MSIPIPLTNENYNVFALHHYYSKEHLTSEEFGNSLKRIVYINKLLNKKDNTNHRLILNHIIITANEFSPHATSRMLFFKIHHEKFSKIKTYLTYLRYLPEDIPEVDLSLIDIDQQLLSILEKL